MMEKSEKEKLIENINSMSKQELAKRYYDVCVLANTFYEKGNKLTDSEILEKIQNEILGDILPDLKL